MNRVKDSITKSFKGADGTPPVEQKPKIFLALQGGGSHGAFTAGVIEALHDAGVLADIKGISGTSAGAFNAAPLSYALNKGKPKLAITMIKEIWDSVASTGQSIKTFNSIASFNPYFATYMGATAPYPNLSKRHIDHGSGFIQFAQLMGMKTQAEDIKERVDDVIPDWSVIQKGDIETIICATKVEKRNSKTWISRKYFGNTEIDADAIAASATLFGTHKKDGAEYVDGALTDNLPLEPFFDGDYTDVIAITLSQMPRAPLVPEKQRNLINGADFLHEEVYSELAWATLHSNKNIHVINMEHEPHWNETSKMNSEPRWINDLKKRGYEAGAAWAAQHKVHLGKKSTFRPEIAKSPELGLDNNTLAVA